MCRLVVPRREFLRLASAVCLGALYGCSGSQPPVQPVQKSALGQGRQDQTVRIGYLPITDASPLLIAHARGLYQAEGLTVAEPVLFRSWSQLLEAFQARQVNVIHMLMPAAFWVRYYRRHAARIVAWNHVNGSALTVHAGVSSLSDLGGKTVAVPFWYSVHNLIVQSLLRNAGLEPVLGAGAAAGVQPNQVRLVVMSPSDMPPALAAGQIAGFIVAEPFNALSEVQTKGRIFRFTGDVWKEHACCVVLLDEADLQERPEWSQAVVNAIVRAQAWIRPNREETAHILSQDGGKYTPHSAEVLKRVLTYYDPNAYGPQGAIIHPEWQAQRIDFQPYPYPSYTEAVLRSLKETRVEGETGFLSGLEPSFVTRDLVDYELVKKAVNLVGGPSAFAQAAEWQREEVIRP